MKVPAGAWILPGILAGLLAGASAQAADVAAPPACVSASALKPVDLADLFLRHDGEIELKGGASCMRTEKGVELPALLLALPAFEAPYSVRIAALLGHAYYLEPRVDLLDGQFQVLRSFGAERLKRRGTEMSMQVFIDAANAGEKYLLLYADPEHFADKDQKTTSQAQTVYVGTGFLILGNEQTEGLSATTIGKLNITLVGEQWDKALKAQKQHR